MKEHELEAKPYCLQFSREDHRGCSLVRDACCVFSIRLLLKMGAFWCVEQCSHSKTKVSVFKTKVSVFTVFVSRCCFSFSPLSPGYLMIFTLPQARTITSPFVHIFTWLSVVNESCPPLGSTHWTMLCGGGESHALFFWKKKRYS